MKRSLKISRNILFLIFSILIAAFSVVLSQYGSRGGLVLNGIQVLILICTFRSHLGKAIFSPKILSIIIITLFATIVEILMGGTFSYWQLFRSHIWAIITLIAMWALSEAIQHDGDSITTDIYDISSVFIVIIALITLIDIATSINIAPAYIDRFEETDVARRIYVPGHEIGIALIPYAIYKKHLLRAAAMIFLLLITAGKTTLVVTAIAVCYGVYIMPKRDKLSILVSISIFVVGGAYSLVQMWQRFVGFSETGDTRRLDQVSDGLTMVTSNLFRLLFGVGLATPYSEGYFSYNLDISSADLTALHENAMYDLENGYAFLLLRFGVIGSMIYLVALYKKYFSLNVYAFVILCIWWTSSAPVGFLNVNLMICMIASGYLLSKERLSNIRFVKPAHQHNKLIV